MAKAKRQRKLKSKRIWLHLGKGLSLRVHMMAESMGLTHQQLVSGSVEHIWKLYEEGIWEGLVPDDSSSEDFGEYCHDSDPTFSGVDELSYKEACDERTLRERDGGAVKEGASLLEGEKC